MKKRSMVLLLLASSSLLASIGKVSALNGSATITRDGVINQVKAGMELEEHDRIKTAANTKLQVVFNDNTVISLGQKSDFSVDEYLFDEKKPKARFHIARGFFKSITGKIGHIAPQNFKVKTANATIGVRGTTIIGEVEPKVDIIACSKGEIEVTTPKGSVIVKAGERTTVTKSQPPTKAKKINSVLMKQLDSKSSVEATDAQASKTEQKQAVSSKDLDEVSKKPQTLKDIQNIVGEQKPTYEGKIVQGSTSHGKIDSESSKVKLGFDLGSGDVKGDVKFRDSSQKHYDIGVAGKAKGDGSFDFAPKGGYEGKGSGNLHGEKLEKASGDFNFKERDLASKKVINNIEGKFEAKRK